MTEDERKEIREKYQDDSLGVLLKKIIVLLGKYIAAFLYYILKLVLKGIVWCCRKCSEAMHALKEFWNSSDTQEKKEKAIELTKQGIRDFGSWCRIAWQYSRKYTALGLTLAWKYICIGSHLFLKYFLITLIAIWHGIEWTVVTIKDLIIHSKPTFIRLGKDIRQGAIDFGHWIIRVGRGFRLRRIRRKRAWQNFRRNKGFKGLLIDMGHGLNSGIKSYMTEEESETSPEAITEDDIFAEEIEEKQGDKHKFGKKLFKGVKDIVEDKE